MQLREKKEESKNNSDANKNKVIDNTDIAIKKRCFNFYCVNMMTLLDVDNFFKEEDKEGNENNISLSCHIEKKNNNEIYYYKYTNLLHNKSDIKSNIFYFKCCDSKCNAISLLYLNDDDYNNSNSNIFKSLQGHNISYDSHSYVINPSKGNKFYNKIMNDNCMLKNLQLIKFSKYFINMVYFDHFFKEQYKYDIKNTFNKKKEKKFLNKKIKDNSTIMSENKSKKSVNVTQKIKKINQGNNEKKVNKENNKKGEIIEIIDDDV